jgi:hypothetical protein
MDQLIGAYKEFIVIERKVLEDLIEYAEELKNEPGVHTQGLSKGIEYAINKVKENNIYNNDFKIKS